MAKQITVNWIRFSLENMDIKQKFDLKQRFVKFLKSDKNGCKTWIGAKSKGKRKTKNSEYGSFSFKRKTIRSHLFAYAFDSQNDIQENFHIDHICGNSLCCNPEHLRCIPATQNCSEGSLRRFASAKI